MNIKKLTLKDNGLPEVLRTIPDPPAGVWCQGAPLEKLLRKPRVAIVGSRGPTPYGRAVTDRFASKLAERGIVIVSGLALGIDSLAHQAALRAGGICVAVLPSPLDNILPAANRRLAAKIIERGGALISEYALGTPAYKHNFVARNRLVSGFSQAVLITEAAEKSGSLHTAAFALDQGREVMAVPGNITSAKSAGTNNLIKAGAAQPVTVYGDVLHALNLPDSTETFQKRGRNASEQTVLDLLGQGIDESRELLSLSRLTASEFNSTVTMLEISGRIRPLGANRWCLA